MTDVQEELLSHEVSASHIKSAAHLMRIFLIWVLFACFYDISIYHFNADQFSHYLNLCFLGISCVAVIGWSLITYLLFSRNTHVFNLDILCQLLCLIIGCALGIGIFIINHSSVMVNEPLNYINLTVLPGLTLSIVHILGITYLTQRFRYFLFIFIPSVISIFFWQLLFPQNIPTLYNLIINIWFTVIFVSAVIAHQHRKQLELLKFKSDHLSEQSEIHQEKAYFLQSKLQEEINKSQEIKQQLQLNNQLLEQKVKERTYDIKQINDRLENHQANLTLAHETAGISSWLWNIDKRTISFSHSRTETSDRQFTTHASIFDVLIHPDDLENYRQLMRRHLRGFTERFEATYRIHRLGEWFWIQDIGKVVARHPATNKPLRMVGIHRDIHKEKKDQEQLKLAASVFDQVAEGVFILDNNLCYLDVNPFFEKLIGFKKEQLIGQHIFDITVNDQREIHQTHSQLTQQLILTGEYDAEIQEEFLSGRKLTLWIHINSITDDKNKVINYVGILTDLTDRIKQEQRLSYLENYDLLTDLPNRFYFNLQLHHYVTNNAQSLKHFAVIRINIDRFRSFNEFLSNHAGDELLKQVSQRLRQCCANALLISYLNNDDFAIIYNLNHNNTSIHQHTQNILNTFRQPFVIDGQEQIISISIGVAVYPEHGRQIDSLNSHAELALCEAKRLGGNTIHYYANKSAQLLNKGINLERDLRNAIRNNEFEVYYQPKLCLQTRRIYGFEALVRWNHPELGLIAPDMFIPLAEESSLITDIGQFVLFETCKQIKSWQNMGFDNLRVSVNIVAQQIHRGQLLDDIDQALARYRMSGDMLELELTESSLLDKSEHVMQLLRQIKERHISISLDDFGTGYSSLAYLTNYPIDTLKIDRAFISKIGQEKDEAIVNAIIAMGKAMGMTLIAEGVETRQQVEFLENQGCFILQGFYYAKPLNANDSTLFLSQYKF
ncbi:EAL domain-containing protein [Acinetobacter sp. WZC-1]|uniref:EAL domain-containing protein n=1 Tax=Acinetobacter sp. WZC-1 TaxID=3459034 RepID=UPI00403E1382